MLQLETKAALGEMSIFSVTNRKGDTQWEVQGYAYGAIGIHHEEFYGDQQWILTHIPTGLSITTFDAEEVPLHQIQRVAFRLNAEVKGIDVDSKWKARLAFLVWSDGENPIERVRGLIQSVESQSYLEVDRGIG